MAEPHSDAFVFFGASGDLAYKQIFPALQSLIRHGQLDLPIIGVAMSPMYLRSNSASDNCPNLSILDWCFCRTYSKAVVLCRGHKLPRFVSYIQKNKRS